MNPEIDRLEREIADLQQRLADAHRKAALHPVRGDYRFVEPTGSAVSLRDLFGPRRDLLIIHNMGQRCVYCTLWADGFNGVRQHLENRAALALCSPDAPDVQRTFAASRGWGFRMIGPAPASTFSHDMGFQPDPSQPAKVLPGVSAFHLRDDGSIVRTGRASFGPGDPFCSVWPLLDLLHSGPGDWAPRFRYD